MTRLQLTLTISHGGIDALLRCPETGFEARGRSEVTLAYLLDLLALRLLQTGGDLSSTKLEFLGRALGDAAVPAEIRKEFIRFVLKVGIGLSLNVPNELDNLPWEFMFIDAPEVGFLATHPGVRFSRYKMPLAAFEPARKPRVLVAFSDPDVTRFGRLVKCEDEFDAVCRALSKASPDLVTIDKLPHATARQLGNALKTQKYDLLHFIGHAEARPSGGVIVMEGASSDDASEMYADELSRLLQFAGVKLVALSACSTYGAPFGGNVVATGVPALVGMQMPVSDVLAHLFFRTFYAALGGGLSLEEAMFEGRSAIGGSTRDWGAPVLVTSSPADALLSVGNDAGSLTNGNLPGQSSTFIGRERELDRCKTILESAKCVILLGSGGIGKTRLSLEVGRSVGPRFKHGVWFVQLESLTANQQVLEAIALVFGIRATVDHSLEDRIAEFLSDRRLLLILDNCEHLVTGCREAVRLILNRCPDVRILASSREVLSTGLEAVVRVPSLSYPAEVDPEISVLPVDGTAAEYEAVRLLLRRAESADSNFAPSDSDACAFARIAKRLDGIPLALELAASRVRTLTPIEILDRLTHDLAWLDYENVGAVPRHKTLRAALDWSYRLLSPAEKTTFNRLGVFLAGFTLEAAEAVAGFGDFERIGFLNLVSSLVDKSLVISERVNDRMRFRLLDTCRHYALEKLAESGEESEVRDRHFNRMSAFVSATYAAMFVNEEGQRRAFFDFKVEQDNCLSALEWAIAKQDSYAAAGEMTRLLFNYWYFSRDFKLAKRTIDRVLLHSPSDRDLVYLQLLVLGGTASVYMGDLSGLDLALRANEVAKEVDPALADKNVTSWAADCATMAGQFEHARHIFEDQLRYRRENGLDEKTVTINLGSLLIHFNELDQAEEAIGCFLKRGRELGNRRDIGHCFCFLAQIALLRGDSAFRARFAEGIEHLAFVNDLGALGDFLPLASNAFLPSKPEVAAAIQGFADRLIEESGSLRDRLVQIWSSEVAAKTKEATGPLYEQRRKDGRTANLSAILQQFSALN